MNKILDSLVWMIQQQPQFKVLDETETIKKRILDEEPNHETKKKKTEEKNFLMEPRYVDVGF